MLEIKKQAKIRIVNNSLPNKFKNSEQINGNKGVVTILKSLYGIKPFAIFRAKL